MKIDQLIEIRGNKFVVFTAINANIMTYVAVKSKKAQNYGRKSW
jgi:hypothetical protein